MWRSSPSSHRTARPSPCRAIPISSSGRKAHGTAPASSNIQAQGRRQTRIEAVMTRPINIHRFAHLLSASEDLDTLERRLRHAGDVRSARKIADVREAIAKALQQEQEEIYERLAD